VRFVPRALARKRFEEQFPALATLPGEAGGDIFPPSFEVVLRPAYRDPDVAERLASGFRLGPGVADVRFDRGWFDKLKSLVALARGGGYGIGTLLVLAVMITVGVVVQLSVLARREEIAIMKLVGASAGFIRGPFFLQAAAQGLLGGLAAAAGLALTWRLFVGSAVYRENPFMAMVAGQFLPASGLAGLAAAGVVLGLLAAAVSLHRAASV
jgi:cell division transport system permease protein